MCRQDNREDFAKLVLLSSTELLVLLFAPHPERVLKNLFIRPRNLFGFRHACFAQLAGRTAGMTLSYGYKDKRKEGLNTGYWLMRELGWRFFFLLPRLLRLENTTGNIGKDEYYISNLAVYPEFRNRGIGQLLMKKAEERARAGGYARIALDVAEYNEAATRLYAKLGYRPTWQFRQFRRMAKLL